MSNRNSRTWVAALSIAGLLAAGASSPITADHGNRVDGEYLQQKDQRKAERKDQRKERARRGGISLDDAAAKVRKQTGGRVLSADTSSHRGDTVHRIKVLLPSGRVRVYLVDAVTGEMR
jgi:uncharacterized membrane protein YkoI